MCIECTTPTRQEEYQLTERPLERLPLVTLLNLMMERDQIVILLIFRWELHNAVWSRVGSFDYSSYFQMGAA